MIEYNGNLTDALLDKFAGMAARRLAVLHNRKRGMSWLIARKLSLSAKANDDIKEALKKKIINEEKHPKDAIHEVVEENALLDEFAGMAARRLAVLHNRKRGMSWSVARKLSLSAMANDDIKKALKIKIDGGMHPRDAIHEVVEERKPL